MRNQSVTQPKALRPIAVDSFHTRIEEEEEYEMANDRYSSFSFARHDNGWVVTMQS